MPAIPSTIPPYLVAQGPFRSAPVSYRGQQGVGVGVQLTFEAVENPGVGVGPAYFCSFNQGAAQVLPSMQSVYVDNSSNNNAVVLVAQDTNFRIVCPALSSGFFPVITNGIQLIAYVDPNDFVDTGVPQTTNLFALSIPLASDISNDNIPGIDYQLILGAGTGAGFSQVFPVVYGSQWGGGTINPSTPSINFFNLTNGNFLLTDFDIELEYTNNTTASDELMNGLLAINYGGGLLVNIYEFGVLFPTGTIETAKKIANISRLQFPLFGLADQSPQSLSLSIFNPIGGIDFSIKCNAYLGRVP